MDLVSSNVIVIVMCLIFGVTTSKSEPNRTTLYYSNYQKVTSVSYLFRGNGSQHVLRENNPVVASADRKNSSGSQNSTAGRGFQDSPLIAKAGSYALTTVPVNTKECVVRVIEIIDGEEKLIAYNETRSELEREGKEVFDEICEGDPDWDKALSKNSLCSLVDATNCDFKNKDGNFKDKVKKIPKSGRR